MSSETSTSFGWMNDYIHDRSHFTSRYLQNYSNKIGVTPETLARCHVALISVVVCVTSLAHFFANALLVLFPFLLIFIFPEEIPSIEKLQLYFTLFGAITIFDRYFEMIPLYYLTKLLFFLLIFVPKYEFAYRLEKANSAPKSASLKNSQTLVNSSNKKTTTTSSSSQNDKATSTRQEVTKRKNEKVKKTIIEEYYREEELLSPKGTVIHRKVTGPFQRIVSESENTLS